MKWIDLAVEAARVINQSYENLAGAGIERPRRGSFGYAWARSNIVGVAVLSSRNFGVELAKRLKNGGPALQAEANFWAVLMARAAYVEGFRPNVVTCPPSSGKQSYYLAENLARFVGAAFGVPAVTMFINYSPRGHRAVLQEKLREVKRYGVIHRVPGEVLIVDDVIQTGLTMEACAKLLNGQKIYGVTLTG